MGAGGGEPEVASTEEIARRPMGPLSANLRHRWASVGEMDIPIAVTESDLWAKH
jgi:hypothetical protein